MSFSRRRMSCSTSYSLLPSIGAISLTGRRASCSRSSRSSRMIVFLHRKKANKKPRPKKGRGCCSRGTTFVRAPAALHSKTLTRPDGEAFASSQLKASFPALCPGCSHQPHPLFGAPRCTFPLIACRYCNYYSTFRQEKARIFL